MLFSESSIIAEKKIAPFGSWKSPITADIIVKQSIRLREIVLDGEDTYWIEGRPSEGGRNVIVRMSPDGKRNDLISSSFNARTRVHEYGGGSFTVKDRVLYFSNFEDQRLYRKLPGKNPEPITPKGDLRYADGVIDDRRKRLICVREDHRSEVSDPINTLVSISFDGENEGKVLVSGNDFYSSPRQSPDGKHLTWLTWNHPNMPWDGTELWLGEVRKDGSIGNRKKVAGGINESIFQPEWSPDGTLYFISDQSGYWNLYRLRDGESEHIVEMDAEFGVPQWGFGLSAYGFISKDQVICTYSEGGIWHLAMLDLKKERLESVEVPYSDITFLKVGDGRVVFRGGSPTELTSIVRLDIETGQIEVLKRSSEVSIDSGYLSIPEEVGFPTEAGLKAHGFYYAPKNKDYISPDGELPPLIVISHGGPTSSTSSTLSLSIQYWTSRGFAVFDVNYGGSTGYGRAYRERLKGRWGVVDVEDCVNGARYLAKSGKVDKDRLIIRGGSAGGYTTLSALTLQSLFKAGASYYGVSDLEALARETHKFESRYLDGLIGPYPEEREIYRERSPINFTERLSSPVIFFQGLEDKVVSPSQAELMVDALRKKGIPVAYITFAHEQHGFRCAENIKRSLEAELYFYSRVFGFELADKVEPVEIENL